MSSLAPRDAQSVVFAGMGHEYACGSDSAELGGRCVLRPPRYSSVSPNFRFHPGGLLHFASNPNLMLLARGFFRFRDNHLSYDICSWHDFVPVL